MLINNQNYLHGRLVGIGKIRKDGSREFRFLEKPINNMILRCGLNEFMTYNGSNTNVLNPASNNMTSLNVIEYCGFGTGNQSNDFANTVSLENPVINPYSTREQRDWPFNGLFIENGSSDSYKVRLSHLSTPVNESVAVREIGYFKNYNSSNHLFSRIFLPAPFQLEAGDKLITTYELVISFARNPINFINCGLHDSSDNELDCQIAQCIYAGTTSSIFGTYPTTISWTCAYGGSYQGYQYAPYVFLDRSGSMSWYQSSFDLRYTKSYFNFPTGTIPQMSYRGINADKVTCQKTDYTPDSFKRDVIVNVPAYWPEMTVATDYRDIYAINWGTLFVRFGHFDANNDFTPAPWRKLASRTAKFVFRQSIATVDSLSWTPPSE